MIKKFMQMLKEHPEFILHIFAIVVLGTTVALPVVVFFARLFWAMAFTPLPI